MTDTFAQIKTIAAKEIRDAVRTHLLTVLTAFLVVAALVSLTVSAIALHGEYLSYIESRDLLISMGKSAADLAPPAFFPLKLLRGFVEHIEIIGAVLGIVLGYRAAAVERGHLTLALIMTRPLSQFTFLAGKVAGNATLIALALTATFVVGTIALALISGVGLSGNDLLRIVIVLGLAFVYVTSFFLLGFILALYFKKLPTALMVAFSIWLTLVLVAPQIGDTMDPDNQVAGGVFRKLEIAKPLEKEKFLLRSKPMKQSATALKKHRPQSIWSASASPFSASRTFSTDNPSPRSSEIAVSMSGPC